MRVSEGDEKGGKSAMYIKYSPQSPGEGGRITPAAGGRERANKKSITLAKTTTEHNNWILSLKHKSEEGKE